LFGYPSTVPSPARWIFPGRTIECGYYFTAGAADSLNLTPDF